MTPLVLTASLDSLSRVTKHVLEHARSAGVPPDKELRIDLVLEEILVNIINHAYKDGQGEVEVDCEVNEHGFCCTLSDTGPPFDPLGTAPHLPEGDIDHRPAGGVGLTLVTTMADRCTYRRQGNRNQLTFCFATQ